MLKYFLASIAALFAVATHAQLDQIDNVKKLLTIDSADTVAWTHGGVYTLGVNQGFLHNWPAGGELGSMTINSQFSGYATRIFHRHIWTTNLDAAYGLFYGYSNKFRPRKVDDRFDLTSKYGLQLDHQKRMYLTGLANFRSQFTKGYDYNLPNYDSVTTSKFLSPAYLTGAIGLEYRNDTHYSLFFSPAAARITFADRYYTLMKPEGAFGVPYGKRSRFELGAYWSGRFMTEVSKKFLFRTRLDLYANYLAKDQKDAAGNVVKKDHRGNIDILWDNFLSFKFTKYIGINIGATMIYDNDIPYSKDATDATTGITTEKDEPAQGLGWWQVKQIMSIGLEYRF